MLKSYLRTAVRSLLKSRFFTAINILGLAVGMAAFLFIVHYVKFERSYEDFNPNAKDVLRITLNIYKGSEFVMTDCEVQPPLGQLLKDKLPEVKDFTRMFHLDNLREVKSPTQRFMEDNIYFADPSALEILGVRVIKGNPAGAFDKPFQTIFTASMARKYFGDDDPVGQAVDIAGRSYHITAVIDDSPANTHLKYNILVTHATLPIISDWYEVDSWTSNNDYLYVLTEPGTNLTQFNEKLAKVSDDLKEKIDYSRFGAEPMKDIHLYSNKSFEPEANGSAKVVYFLLAIAIFIIVIAWVNYINLSTARAVERAREVGIRKVLGSLNRQLIFQFGSEAVITNVIAGLLAFVIFLTALPMFRDLTGQTLPLNFINDASFWYLLTGMIVVGSVLSGFYPAVILSSFKPAAVLKGKFQSSRHGQRLRQGLVVFQFGSTAVLIICLCAVSMQVSYLQGYELGMNVDQSLAIRVPRMQTADSVYRKSFQNLKTELLRNPEVINVGRSDALPGLSVHEMNTTTIRRYGEHKENGNYEYYFFTIDEDFLPTLDVKFIAGRNFVSGSSNTGEIIVNEETARLLGFETPEQAVGGRVTFRTRTSEFSTIIGVVRDFYIQSPKEKQIPLFFYYGERMEYLTTRLASGNMAESVAKVRESWDKIFPGALFSYFFVDETYQNQYTSEIRFGAIIGLFSGLAIFIACLGLFGLSSYTIVQRTKEIGIRKVLGASVSQIVTLLSSDFIRVVAIASFLSMPIAYYIIDDWLASYSVRIQLNALLFLLPVAAILIVAFVTVSFQTFKTAGENPVKSLRQE